MKLLKLKLSLFGTYRVKNDGKAPTGLKAGDSVVTAGGTYTITGVNSDGTYTSSKTSDTTTKNYGGSYDSVGSSSGSGTKSNYSTYDASKYGGSGTYQLYNKSGTGMDSNGNITDYSQYLQYLMENGSLDYNEINNAYQQRLQKAGAMGLNDENSQNFNKTVSAYLQNLSNQSVQKLIQDAYDDMYAQIGDRPTNTRTNMDNLADKLANAALNMNYDDWQNSDQYKALVNRYGLQGNQSMRDVLGQVSSRTGGLASSYATTAAQQQYNDFMSGLEKAAYEMYGNEQNTALSKAQNAYDFADNEYQRFLDEYSQWNDDRSYAYNILTNAISNSKYNKEWETTQAEKAKTDAQDRIASFAANGGSYDGLSSDLISASGLTDNEIRQIFTKAQQSNSKGSGSASSGSNSGNYKTALNVAKGKTSPVSAWNYLSEQYDAGHISYDDAMKIFQLELGYSMNDLPSENEPTSTDKANFTGLSEGEFNRSTAMQQQFGNYQEYLKWWYANH